MRDQLAHVRPPAFDVSVSTLGSTTGQSLGDFAYGAISLAGAIGDYARVLSARTACEVEATVVLTAE